VAADSRAIVGSGTYSGTLVDGGLRNRVSLEVTMNVMEAVTAVRDTTPSCLLIQSSTVMYLHGVVAVVAKSVVTQE
jgi:hypothetical protein